MFHIDKARFAACKAVLDIYQNSAYSNIALANALRSDKLTNIDRRFTTELVYGTVKLGKSLDWIISKFLTRPLKDVDPKILAILRISFYQIFFLDRVPNFASINESVQIAKNISIPASKFVNAVLRSATRNPEKATFPSDDSPASISLSTYHPKWLIKRWINLFGVDLTKKICNVDNSSPPLTLRINSLKVDKSNFLSLLDKLNINYTTSKLVDEAVICQDVGELDNFCLLQDGLCQVQDESSMLAVHALDPQPGEFVIDACAAPGGKSTHIAQLMNNRGHILSCDLHEHKLKLLDDNVERLGINIIESKLLDARKLGTKFKNTADRVLVDAPCSGLGVLRRKADLRWAKKPQDIASLPQLQLDILKSVSAALKPGGTLVYSTCTLEPNENQGVVEQFLSSFPNFKLISQNTLLPHLNGCDGFFISKLLKS